MDHSCTIRGPLMDCASGMVDQLLSVGGSFELAASSSDDIRV